MSAKLGRCVQIVLDGPPGNPRAYGAKVTVVLDSGLRQTAEVTAGSGYLSQSSPTLSFTEPAGTVIEKILVRWPDGRETTEEPLQFTGSTASDDETDASRRPSTRYELRAPK